MWQFEVPDVHLWVYRITVVLLTWLSIVYLKRRKNLSSYLIFIGLIITIIGIVIEAIAAEVAFRDIIPFTKYMTLQVLSSLLVSLGYIISVYGCYRVLFKEKA
jgi:uncharacterized membrane protein